MEGSMSKATLDNRHRNKDGEISAKHGNTLIRTLRKVYGRSFAAGYSDTEKLGEGLLKLNEKSFSHLRSAAPFISSILVGSASAKRRSSSNRGAKSDVVVRRPFLRE